MQYGPLTPHARVHPSTPEHRRACRRLPQGAPPTRDVPPARPRASVPRSPRSAARPPPSHGRTRGASTAARLTRCVPPPRRRRVAGGGRATPNATLTFPRRPAAARGWRRTTAPESPSAGDGTVAGVGSGAGARRWRGEAHTHEGPRRRPRPSHIARARRQSRYGDSPSRSSKPKSAKRARSVAAGATDSALTRERARSRSIGLRCAP